MTDDGRQILSDTEEDAPMMYSPPDPFRLKQLGNDAYAKKELTQAIELWKQALKEALKKSVRTPSKELSELQMVLRLNLARGFFEDEDYVMAKEHLTVVYENQPDNKKVYYRFAEVYLKLWDYDRARAIIKEGLRYFPDDPALITMQRRVEFEEKSYERDLRSELKRRVDLRLKDERAERAPSSLLPFDPSKHKNVMEGEPTTSELDAFCHDVIDWRHDTTLLVDKEVQSDIDDWRNARDWLQPHNGETLKHDRTAQYLSLPLSILATLENALRGDVSLQREKIRNDVQLPPLPKMEVDPNPRLRTEITEWLTRQNKPRPFTIHVVGARGDVEMECKWSAILDRLPHLDVLQVVMIGFTDPDDPYSRRLKEEGYLSPPLAKKNGLRGSQKFIARLFRGKYRDFLVSDKVQDLCSQSRDFIKDATADFLHVDDDHKVPLHPVLLFDDHPLHPDLIVLPEPNFSRHFESWAGDFAQMMFSNIPVILYGHSVMEGNFASHEAQHFASLIPKFGPKTLVPLIWNPFSLVIDPQGCPPMPVVDDKGQTVMYSGLSGKYAVAMMVRGCGSDADKPLLSRLIESTENVQKWMTQLKSEGIDVDRELQAVDQYMNDPETQDQAQRREAEIEAKAQTLKDQLKARMSCD